MEALIRRRAHEMWEREASQEGVAPALARRRAAGAGGGRARGLAAGTAPDARTGAAADPAVRK